MRLLFTILLIIIIVSFLKLIYKVGKLFFLIKKSGLKDFMHIFNANSNNAHQQHTNNNENQKIVKCAKCQLYIPEDKAYHAHGDVYCCEQHAK